jgi:putative flippase GtrA
LVGVLNTLIDAAFYFLLSRSGLIPSLILAKGVSYAVGVLNSFYWNKSWTFQSHMESRRVFLPFVAANLLAVGLNAGVMDLALNTLGLPEPGALALATMTTFVWNFVTSKFFIFK